MAKGAGARNNGLRGANSGKVPKAKRTTGGTTTRLGRGRIAAAPGRIKAAGSRATGRGRYTR